MGVATTPTSDENNSSGDRRRDDDARDARGHVHGAIPPDARSAREPSGHDSDSRAPRPTRIRPPNTSGRRNTADRQY